MGGHELIWLRIGKSGGLLCTRYWIFGFHKIHGIFSPTQELTVSREGLSSTELAASQTCMTTNMHKRTVHKKQFCWQILTNVKHHLTFIFDCINNTKLQIQGLGNRTVGFTIKTENKPAINIIQHKQEPSPQNTTGRNTKSLEILHIICILLVPSIWEN
jgi:hypothetical protein